MRPRRRDLIGGAVVAAWLGVMGLLWREHAVRGPALAALPAGIEDTEVPSFADDWYGAYVGQEKIGWARLSRRPAEHGGFRLGLEASLALPAFGQSFKLTASGHCKVDAAFTLRQFDGALEAWGTRFEASGHIRGKLLKWELKSSNPLDPTDPGSRRSASVMLTDAPVLDLTVAPRVARARPRAGEKFRMSSFSLRSLRNEEVEVEVLGYERMEAAGSEFWVAHTITRDPEMPGVEMHAWADADGNLIRADAPLGTAGVVRLVREKELDARAGAPRAGARAPGSAGGGAREGGTAAGGAVAHDGGTAAPAMAAGAEGAFDFAALVAVPTTGDVAQLAAADRAARLRLRVRGLGPEDTARLDLDDAEGGRQRWDGDVLTVTRDAPAGPAGDDAARREALRPELLVESDDATIIARARALVPDAGPAPGEAAARALYDWVFEHLEKVNVIGVPSAVTTLRRGSGDCNEHTALYVALARAAGLPARTAIGLVYSRDHRKFLYHAWPEVLVEGTWRAVDPTWGQWPADVTHIRLLRGGFDRQMELSRVLGRLAIEVLPP